MIELARAKSEELARDDRRSAALPGRRHDGACRSATSSVDVVTTGYGLRNVPALGDALDEIARVLMPGGRLLSLDFNRPDSAVVRHALPGLSDGRGLRAWLGPAPRSRHLSLHSGIGQRYPGAEGIASLLGARGFADVRVIPLMFGFMTLHVCATEVEPREILLGVSESEACIEPTHSNPARSTEPGLISSITRSMTSSSVMLSMVASGLIGRSLRTTRLPRMQVVTIIGTGGSTVASSSISMPSRLRSDARRTPFDGVCTSNGRFSERSTFAI